MILDKLIEKKDIIAYCIARTRKLDGELKNIKKFPKNKRQYITQKVLGRIAELKLLRKFLVRNEVKTMAKEWW